MLTQFLKLYMYMQYIIMFLMLKRTKPCYGNSIYHEPHFFANRSIIVHLFEWTFLDIAYECRAFLGPKGYAGVQLSPAFEHVFYNTTKYLHPWWERYEFLSYRIASRSGYESDFWTMSRICNDNGVRLYADVNLNNMAALPIIYMNDTNIDDVVISSAKRSINISNYNYPDVPYTVEHFHQPFCMIKKFKNNYNLRNCQRYGRPDLNHTNDDVKKILIDMLNHFIKMGVAGFRIDAAKYARPKDIRYIFDHVNDLNVDFHFVRGSRPFVYYDVLDLNLNEISKTEYSSHGMISEYLYGIKLSDIINGKESLTTLINWGPAMGFISSQNALVFVDTYDTQMLWPQQKELLTYHQYNKYIMANIFMLAHPFGHIKRIMSSYYYTKTNVNHSPPIVNDKDVNSNIRSPLYDDDQDQCLIETGWLCEHRWPIFIQMLAYANYFSVQRSDEEKIIHFQTNGPNQIAFCRGYKAFIAMNNDPIKIFNKKIYTCLPIGIYCDIVSGGLINNGKQYCSGHTLIINERGYTQLQLLPRDNDDNFDNFIKAKGRRNTTQTNYGIIIVYVGSKLIENMI